MSVNANYKRFLKILEKWPLDKNKRGRDLGVHIRDEVKKAFNANLFNDNSKECDEKYEVLKRLADNKYKEKYPRKSESSATGLNAEQCNQVLSKDFLDYLEKENQVQFAHTCKRFCTAVEKPLHVPVMADKVLKYLSPSKQEVFLDMTFGAGGHSKRILDTCPNVKVFALDRDPTAYEIAKELSTEYPGRLIPLLGKFSDLPVLLKSYNINQNSLDGMLFDLGCSSMQFDTAGRGFSLSKNGPLDMRMDGNRCADSVKASDVLAVASEEDLAKILKVYGEEKQAKKIARAIVEARYTFKPLTTTQELADLVDSVCSGEVRLDKLRRFSSTATKTFQALRIFVNNELNEINYALVLAHKYLKLGGRLVAITFHSLEDRIVKRHIHGNVIENMAVNLPLKYSSHSVYFEKEVMDEVMDPNWESLSRNILTPTYDEVESNPRSRSAKLRAAIRVK